MTPVVWTRGALDDLRTILEYVAARSLHGAATISARVYQAEQTIAMFPRASRRNADTGTYEAVVTGVPLLMIYDLVTTTDGEHQADIIAVFHTSRDPTAKPGRRE
jgi:plasmid stabilization system protein ParE